MEGQPKTSDQVEAEKPTLASEETEETAAKEEVEEVSLILE